MENENNDLDLYSDENIVTDGNTQNDSVDLYSDERGNQNENSGKSSLKKSGLLLVILLLVIIFFLVFMRSCTISRKNESKGVLKNTSEEVMLMNNKSTSSENKVSQKQENTSNTENKLSTNTTESGTNVGSSEVNKQVESSTENNTSNVTPVGEKVSEENTVSVNTQSNTLVKVEGEIDLGDSYQTSVVVGGKEAFLLESKCYVYSINIIFPNGEDYDIVKYFCAKKTFEALNQGDVLKVEYQLDSNGKVSITSISK